MLGIHDFGVFLLAGILLNLTPGQDTLYVVGRTVAQGRSIGVASALGISAGTLIHVTAAALGLSAIIATSATAFVVLKIAGAAYLIYLGLGLLLARKVSAGVAATPASVSAASAFKQGVLTNVTNPKVALFFLAFLPQFIDPESPTRIAALLLLGFTFVTTGTLWCLILALSAAQVRNFAAASARSAAWLSRAAGLLFIALGVRLALSES
jgi:threonine/homoserine/homoserine lactone efflux protein